MHRVNMQTGDCSNCYLRCRCAEHWASLRREGEAAACASAATATEEDSDAPDEGTRPTALAPEGA